MPTSTGAQALLISAPALPRLTAFTLDAATLLDHSGSAATAQSAAYPAQRHAEFSCQCDWPGKWRLCRPPLAPPESLSSLPHGVVAIADGIVIIGTTRPVRAGWQHHSQTTHCAHAITSHGGSLTYLPSTFRRHRSRSRPATAAALVIDLLLVRVKHPCMSWHSVERSPDAPRPSINARHPNHPFSDGDALIAPAAP
jgi:hypothetical protein